MPLKSTCPTCGRVFAVDPYEIRAGRTYCSIRCGKLQPVTPRFWAKVNIFGPINPFCADLEQCWVWTAGRNWCGYGKFWIDGITEGAHRFSWLLAHAGEQIPGGFCVCHHCDNPACVRPSHLFLGSGEANIADKIAKSREAKGERHGSRTHPERMPRGDRSGPRLHPERLPHGEAQHDAKLTEAQVREIRLLRSEGTIYRVIAERFGIQISTAQRVAVGKGWKHVT